MSFRVAGVSPSDQAQLMALMPEVLQNCRSLSQVIGRGGCREESDRWFGDSSNPWMSRLGRTFNKFATVVNLETITVRFRALNHRKGSFAAAQKPKSG
jgi:hypothetical protein